MDVHWLISEKLQSILQWYQGQKYLTAMVHTLFHLKETNVLCYHSAFGICPYRMLQLLTD